MNATKTTVLRGVYQCDSGAFLGYAIVDLRLVRRSQTKVRAGDVMTIGQLGSLGPHGISADTMVDLEF